MTMQPKQTPSLPESQSPSASSHSGDLWDVQDILAERTSPSGESEYLVQWKPSWIPVSNMHPDGPTMRKFTEAPKWKFSSAAGALRLYMPVEPGTVFAQDCATIVAAADTARGAASSGTAAESDRVQDTASQHVARVSQKRERTCKQ